MPLSLYDPRYNLLRHELIRVRKEANLTQLQLAARIGVGQSLISKIERGDAFVDVLFFVEWCTACSTQAGGVMDLITRFTPRQLEAIYAPEVCTSTTSK